jgi:hypothetical protein
MRIRNKPKKPTRKEIHDTFWVYLEDRVAIDGVDGSLMNQVRTALNSDDYYYKKAGITEKSYKQFYLEQDDGYDYTEWHVAGIRDETDAEFKKRQNAYKKAIVKYNEWYEMNKEEIKSEIKRRKEAAEKKRQAEISRLQAKLKKLKSQKST